MKRLFLTTLIILASAPLLFAQQQMHQQMQKMQKMTQNMNDLMERTHAMNQEMNRRMEQVQDEELKNQYQVMFRFNEQMHMALGNMKNAVERCDIMLQNEEMIKDRNMQQEMDRLQEHLGEMSAQAEDAVRSMERLTRRVYQQTEESSSNDN